MNSLLKIRYQENNYNFHESLIDYLGMLKYFNNNLLV